MDRFKVELVSIHKENPYVKVYVNKEDNIEYIRSFLENLLSVVHAYRTLNRACTVESIVVYPMKTYPINEVIKDVEDNLLRYYHQIGK